MISRTLLRLFRHYSHFASRPQVRSCPRSPGFFRWKNSSWRTLCHVMSRHGIPAHEQVVSTSSMLESSDLHNLAVGKRGSNTAVCPDQSPSWTSRHALHLGTFQFIFLRYSSRGFPHAHITHTTIVSSACAINLHFLQILCSLYHCLFFLSKQSYSIVFLHTVQLKT